MTIRKLIEAVGRGDTITSELLGTLPKNEEVPVRRLFLNIIHNGKDLTSALTLHEALLPGWIWNIVDDNATIWRGPPADPMDGVQEAFAEGNPARAWLLALLRAMEGRDG